MVNKDDELGIRLSKKDAEEFDAIYGAKPFMSHGAKMREYILIPASLLSEIEISADYLKKGHSYVCSLPSK